MTVLTASPNDRRALALGSSADSALVVVSLCAAWCHTCGEFREVFERVAAARGGAHFVWLDIEDDHAICGDIDVEDFPTLVVLRGDVVVHYGVSLPQEGIVARLIDELASRTKPAGNIPDEVLALPRALRSA